MVHKDVKTTCTFMKQAMCICGGGWWKLGDNLPKIFYGEPIKFSAWAWLVSVTLPLWHRDWHTCMHVRTQTQTYTCTQTYTDAHTRTHTYARKRTHARTPTCTHTYTHTHTHTRIHTHMHARTHAHTHTGYIYTWIHSCS